MYRLVCMPHAALVLFWSADSGRVAKEKRIRTRVPVLVSTGGDIHGFGKS